MNKSFRNHRYSIRGFGSKNDSEIIFDTSFDKLDVLEQLERVNRDGTHTHSALQTALKSGIYHLCLTMGRAGLRIPCKMDVPKMLKNSKKIIFVLTDGESKYPEETLKSALDLKQIVSFRPKDRSFLPNVGPKRAGYKLWFRKI